MVISKKDLDRLSEFHQAPIFLVSGRQVDHDQYLDQLFNFYRDIDNIIAAADIGGSNDKEEGQGYRKELYHQTDGG